MNTTDVSNRAEVAAALNRELLVALTALKHRHIACWCPHGLGDKFFPHHTAACELAQIVYAKSGGKK